MAVQFQLLTECKLMCKKFLYWGTAALVMDIGHLNKQWQNKPCLCWSERSLQNKIYVCQALQYVLLDEHIAIWTKSLCYGLTMGVDIADVTVCDLIFQ